MNSSLILKTVFSALLFVCVLASPGHAQEKYSPADVLGNEDVQQQLGLSADQVDRITKINDAQKNVFSKYITRLRASKSSEETKKIQEEMQAEKKNLAANRQKNLMAVLTADQTTRLTPIVIRRLGPKAITMEYFNSELKLEDDQAKKLGEIYSEYRRLRRDDREEKLSEYEGKMLQVLNDTQRKTWTKKSTIVGAPASPAAGPSIARPSGAQSGSMGGQELQQSVIGFGDGKDIAPQNFDPNEKITMNVSGARWADILNTFARRAGFTLDMVDIPPGAFNYQGFDTEFTVTKALDIMNGYLITRGYLLVRRGRFLVCMNYDKGVPPNVIPVIEPEELEGYEDHALVTVEYDVTGIEDINRTANEVALLLGPYGFQQVRAIEASARLLVTGLTKNQGRISRLLAIAKAGGSPGSRVFKAIALQYADAEEGAEMLKTMLGQARAVPNVSAVNDRSRFSRSPQPTPTPAAKPKESDEDVQIMAFVPTNSVLIAGTQAQVTSAEEMLKAIDVGESADGTAVIRGGNKPQLRVYKVTNADATEVTKTLSAIIPGVVVNEDGRNGKIHIMATPREHAKVAEYISQLDGSGGGGSGTLDVIFLKRADPINTAMQLRSLFLSEGEAAPAIEPDIAQRSLMVRGTGMQVASIRKFLLMQGEDGVRDVNFLENNRPSGPIRTLPLYGRDPEQILQRIQMLWDGPNPVQVVDPEARRRNRAVQPTGDDAVRFNQNLRNSQPASRISTPETERSAPRRTARQPELRPFEKRRIGAGDAYAPTAFQSPADERPATPVKPRQNLTNGQVRDFFERGQTTRDDNRGPRGVRPIAGPGEAVPNRTPPANARRARFEDEPVPTAPAPIQITRDGDNLIIMSTDLVALDRLQDRIDQLTQSMQPRTQWRVRYLTVADATEVSMMIEQIMPQSSISTADSNDGSIMSGITGFGSDLADITGLSSLGQGSQTLRIIPEVRTNSLWISGPYSLVEEALDVVDRLDASELPESLRDRKPRFIEVKYADVIDVYEDVKSIYKDFLEAQGGGNKQGGGNPFAAMMGGGSSKGSAADREAQKIRMTLAVDERTSSLIVSAKDALFQEVKTLVEEMDANAKRLNRRVVVVPVAPTSIDSIQNSLQSIMPRVSVTAGSGSSSGSSSSNRTSTNQSSGASAMQDAMRARMMGMGFGGRTGGTTGGRGGTTGGRPGGTTGGRGGFGGGFGGGRGGFGRGR